MEKKSKITEDVMERLHDDLFMGILLKLPAKTLVYSKLVAKKWNRVVSSYEFITSHARQVPLSHKILFSTFDQIGTVDAEHEAMDQQQRTILQCAFKRHDVRVVILGSCHGLVAVGADERGPFYIWNPLTGEYHQLPHLRISRYASDLTYGFGYDIETNDYKILVAYEAEGESIFLFSVRKNAWRRLQVPQAPLSNFIGRDDGILIGEVVYWFDVTTNVIVSFDLSLEEFGLLPLPTLGDQKLIFGRLGKLRTGLAMCSTLKEDDYDRTCIWVKSRGGDAHWDPSFYIPRGSFQRLDKDGYENDLRLLCIVRSNEVVALNNGCVVYSYNPETTLLLGLEITLEDLTVYAIAYTETLLSPNDLLDQN